MQSAADFIEIKLTMKRLFFESKELEKPDAMSNFISRMTFLAIVALRWTLENQRNTTTSNTMLLFFSLSMLIASIVIMQREILQLEIPANTGYALRGLMLGCVLSLFSTHSKESYGLAGILLGEVYSKRYRIDTTILKLMYAIHSMIFSSLKLSELAVVIIHCILPLAAKIIKPVAQSPRKKGRMLSTPIMYKRSLTGSILETVVEKDDHEQPVNRDSRSNTGLTLANLAVAMKTPTSRINSGRELPYVAQPKLSESELGRAFESVVDSPESEQKTEIFSSIVCDLEKKDILESQTFNSPIFEEELLPTPKIKFDMAESRMKPKFISESMFDTPKAHPKTMVSRWNSM